MMFYRINEHTVSCVIGENEIIQMGYHIDQLYQDKEVASKFMKDICGKAKEIGFHIGNNVQAVQVALSQNHQMILNFIEINPEEQIDHTIKNLIEAADTVEFIGRDKLEEILEMTGEEKAKAFNECMTGIEENASQEDDETNQEDDEISQDIEINTEAILEQVPNLIEDKGISNVFVDNQEIYMLQFTELSKVEEFCKDTTFEVPGKLYKDRSKYIMMVDLGSLDLQKKGGFIFQAEEYTSDITKGNTLTTYLEEHAETLIGDKPIEVLKKL